MITRKQYIEKMVDDCVRRRKWLEDEILSNAPSKEYYKKYLLEDYLNIKNVRLEANKNYLKWRRESLSEGHDACYSMDALCYCMGLNFSFISKLVTDGIIPFFLGCGFEKKQLFDRKMVRKSLKRHGYYIRPVSVAS